ncbi:MAG: SpoIIE family protein phosphatase [Clostridia bacterium]|nr:SpoIIE family protein phosphatase [Clostridia bacterium]
MFQNISNDFSENKNHCQDVKFNSEEIFILLKKIFSKQNIIIYIISFMISMVSFGGDISLGLAPFGLAILAATASAGIPITAIYIFTLLGSFIGLGKDITASYFLTSLVFFATLFILKTKKQNNVNEKVKLGKNIVISILVVKVLPMVFTSISISNLIFAIMLCIITYIFYKIFANAIDVIHEYGEKKVFSIEELMGASLLIAIAITSLDSISIFGYSLKNVLCILIVLILGWKSGILVGTTGGVTIGIVLGIIGNEPPITVAAFAIAGMLAGIFSKIGKIGVIIGFIAGNIVITYVSDGNIEPIILFQEILIASLGLLLIPKKAELVMNELFDNSSLLPDMNKRTLEESKETVKKLSNISETISEIAKSYDEVAATVVEDKEKQKDSLENKKIFKKELEHNLEGMEDNILYEDIKHSEDILDDIYKHLSNKNKLTKEILILIFAKYNNYIIGTETGNINKSVEKDILDMIEVLNKSYKLSQINFVWKKKMDEKNKNMSVQLQGVSEVISDLAEDIKDDRKELYINEKELINKLLIQKNIIPTEIKIKKNDSNRKIVNIYTKTCDDENNVECNIKKIEKILNKVLGEKMILQKHKCGIKTGENICSYTFMSNDLYNLKVGIARAKKHNSTVSGDTSLQTKLNDGKYLLAISDGMGSGPEARKSSKIAIKMLERMLSSGFKKDVSIKMINSTLSANNDEDMYATLDILILDLYQGNIEFIKNGACPTYIKRNKEVELINSITLPTGIVDNIDLVVYDKDIKNGDIIVMCSDGIIESNSEYLHKDLWLKYFLEEIQTDDVQQIADLIISEAIDNDYGKEKDDMTVIVAKISK